jgi:glycosyltransferase involved in cell wall biosynthesis
MEVQVSVALVTRNRPEDLKRVLASLRDQSVQPFEVVISDDSDEALVPRVQALASAYGCRHVRGPRRGLYANRNHAALACTGTHVRTLDDDHEFPPGHWAATLDALRSDPEAVWIIGEYLPGQERPETPPPCPAQLTARGYSVLPADPQNCWAIADGATIYPRSLFERGLRYAEFLKFGAAYLEFGSRLHWLGYRIRFLDSTYVVHHLNLATRSYSDLATELTSRYFAMLCHSRIYQPGVRAALLSLWQIFRHVVVYRGQALQSLYRAWSAYGGHRRCVLALKAQWLKSPALSPP